MPALLAHLLKLLGKLKMNVSLTEYYIQHNFREILKKYQIDFWENLTPGNYFRKPPKD